MRLHIKFDSATTDEVRSLLVALYRVDSKQDTEVKVEGPECWGGITKPMDLTTAMAVLAEADADLVRKQARRG